ncbi:serine protease [Thalassobius vesicularis]|uniref:Serine protease n=2 Tax=Thalassobius vesicularis TaxID=1294297 RepID=A0A4S3MC72_9RHOB|nr:serine protease [Thalassobius vesicularis]
MKCFARILALILAAWFLPHPTIAQDYANLLQGFDASRLSVGDKRFLQAALAFEGDYQGLLDGAWGRLSQRALARFSARELNEASRDWHMVVLALSLIDKVDRDGWQFRYLPDLGISLLVPSKKLVVDPPSERFANYRHRTNSFSYSVGALDLDAANSIHSFTENWHEGYGKPYIVRKQGLAVTSSTKPTGEALYTRSDFVNGKWSTVMLYANKQDANLLGAVSSSIVVGRTPPLDITKDGYLNRTILDLFRWFDENQKDEEASQKKPTEKRETTGSGSGFVVSTSGHVLTNAHVVDGCREIFVDKQRSQLVGSSPDFDLALLLTQLPASKAPAKFSPSPALLNSDVTVVGYPYAGLLGGLNVTRGAISSLTGLRGEATQMQISAPVQPGNSGGPVVGRDGEVVGVVVAKLNAKKLSEVTGDIPQNVNFAVRGEIAKLFLSQHGVQPLLGDSDEPMEAVALARIASQFTVFIECK